MSRYVPEQKVTDRRQWGVRDTRSKRFIGGFESREKAQEEADRLNARTVSEPGGPQGMDTK